MPASVGVLAAMLVGTTACSADTPEEETPAHRNGRDMGVALFEEGAWPDVSRSKAEDLCRFLAQTEGPSGTEANDYIDGCVTGLRAR
ncbi:hypothetical protein [Streptomyces sp. NBC_00233]|uniref:hypothetical protein n=1 Tax=Streptomyces sp. NBC_00233 TaxID=2975686 RepID=UPI00224DA07B|nr:hypothetical protein [Streptomyces sp. NBC_00233]MCX5232797.1 hypothetical protein [Streptomyces sp. NBC_00233]